MYQLLKCQKWGGGKHTVCPPNFKVEGAWAPGLPFSYAREAAL